MRCTLPLDGIRSSIATEVAFRRVNTKFISIPPAEMAINVLIIICMRRIESKKFLHFAIIFHPESVACKFQTQIRKNMVVNANLSFSD